VVILGQVLDPDIFKDRKDYTKNAPHIKAYYGKIFAISDE
jgi:hypothetical protein